MAAEQAKPMGFAVLLKEGLQTTEADYETETKVRNWLSENIGENSSSKWDSSHSNVTYCHHTFMLLYAHFSHHDGEWHTHDKKSLYGVAFENEDDATHFKLVWGI